MKNFIYLVQGSKQNILGFEYLQNIDSDLVVLTYDFPINDDELNCYKSFFLPKSTWAEGRNLQFEFAKSIPFSYKYYIFLDDDIVFVNQDIKEFEQLLLCDNPGIGLPLCDIVKSSNYYLSFLPKQRPIAIDQLCQAYRSDIFMKSNLLPLVTEFDSESWWYSCEINSYMILTYYLNQTIQYNSIEVLNKNHDWNSKTINTNSVYKSGTSKAGINQIKSYIEGNYGRQELYLNTIFRSEFFPRYLFLYSIKDAFKHVLSLISHGTSIKFSILFLFKFFGNFFYRISNAAFFKNRELPLKIN